MKCIEKCIYKNEYFHIEYLIKSSINFSIKLKCIICKQIVIAMFVLRIIHSLLLL